MPNDVPGISHATTPEMPILRLFFGIMRIRRARVNAENPLHPADDPAHDASNDGADRPSSLVAYGGTVGGTSRNSLGLGIDEQRECEDKAYRQCVKFHIWFSPRLFWALPEGRDMIL
jgi:hypothetical protein